MSVWGDRLDAAVAARDNGESFGGVLRDLFRSAARARDEAEAADGEDEQEQQIREAW